MSTEIMDKIELLKVKYKDDEETLREILSMVKRGMEIISKKNNIQ